MTGVTFEKEFGRHGKFQGRVVGREGQYYQVEYEDGDREELDEEELGRYVEMPERRAMGAKVRRLPGAVTEVSERRQVMGAKVRELAVTEEVEGANGSYISKAQSRLSSGLSARTISKYRTVMGHFKTYLLLEGLDMEAVGVMGKEGNGNFIMLSKQNESLMMGFGEYLVEERRIEVKTAKQYVTNIKTQVSTLSGFDPSYGCKWLRIGRLWGRLEVEHPSRPRAREPILQQHLLKIKVSLNLEEQIYKMYWAAMLMLFFVVGRKADHFPNSRSGFDSRKDTTRSDIRYVSEDLIIVEIKETKTRKQDKNHPGKPLVRDRGNELCPVSALEEYLTSDPIKTGEDPNVIPLFRHGDGTAVSGHDIHCFVKLAARTIGLDADLYGGHSLRIGGATAALACASGDKYSVQVLGMWAGESVMLYTRPTMDMLSVLLLEMMRKKETVATATI